MDEGFNTFINTFSEEDYWKRNDAATRQRERQLVIAIDQMPAAQPILTAANRFKTSNNLLSLAYVKPSIMLLALRSKVLGEQVFDSAFREYTRRWAFKHPQPTDFFRTMEDASGEDLDWFCRGWFYGTEACDISLDSVKYAKANVNPPAPSARSTSPTSARRSSRSRTSRTAAISAAPWVRISSVPATATSTRPSIATSAASRST